MDILTNKWEKQNVKQTKTIHKGKSGKKYTTIKQISLSNKMVFLPFYMFFKISRTNMQHFLIKNLLGKYSL